MKIKEGYSLHNVAGYNIVVPVGETAVNFNGMINLNESGALLWNLLTTNATKEDLVAALLKEYETTEAVALADVDAFIKKMKEANLLDD